MTRPADTARLRGTSLRLSPEQALDLLEGIAHRERYYATHGIAYPATNTLEWELNLALRWFSQWWKQRADAAAVRNHRAQHASPTPELFQGPRDEATRRDDTRTARDHPVATLDQSEAPGAAAAD